MGSDYRPKREPGWYWVKRKGANYGEYARWVSFQYGEYWLLNGMSGHAHDEDLAEIGPREPTKRELTSPGEPSAQQAEPQ